MKKKIIHKTKRTYSVGKKSSTSLIPLLFLTIILVLTFAFLKSGLKLGMNSRAQDKCDVMLYAQITDDKGGEITSDQNDIKYTSNRNTTDSILRVNFWRSKNYIIHNVNKNGIGGLYYPGDYVSWILNDENDIQGPRVNDPDDEFSYRLAGSNVRVCDFDTKVSTNGKNCKDYGISASDTKVSTARVKIECNKKYITGWWYKRNEWGQAPMQGPGYVDKIKFQAQITDKQGNPINTTWDLKFRNGKQIETIYGSKTKLYDSIVPEGREPIDTYWNHSKPALGANVNFWDLGSIDKPPYFSIEYDPDRFTLLGNNVRVCQYNDTSCLQHKKGEETQYNFKDYTCVVRSGESYTKCLSTDSLLLDKTTQVIVGWWFDEYPIATIERTAPTKRHRLFSCNEICTGSNQCESGLICTEVQGEMRCRRASNPSDPTCR